jgi:hypothetical protein
MRIRGVVLFLLIAVVLASQAARFLWIDDPQESDAIVVLAGETNLRPKRGLELLRQGIAPRMWIDVVNSDEFFDQSLVSVAQKYAAGLPEGDRVKVCAIDGLSTAAETMDVRRCLQSAGIHRVLIVTSAFHSRRALIIFKHRLPEYEFSVAAANDPKQFGTAWWTTREWAKTTFEEWTKLVWWEAVDRWR